MSIGNSLAGLLGLGEMVPDAAALQSQPRSQPVPANYTGITIDQLLKNNIIQTPLLSQMIDYDHAPKQSLNQEQQRLYDLQIKEQYKRDAIKREKERVQNEEFSRKKAQGLIPCYDGIWRRKEDVAGNINCSYSLIGDSIRIASQIRCPDGIYRDMSECEKYQLNSSIHGDNKNMAIALSAAAIVSFAIYYMYKK